ncbi:MAG: metallophosphoesterase [Candidatus Aminicenantes bacterium]|nr:metallophosphoesterase [Candidatus Aminicenantes bacterium]
MRKRTVWLLAACLLLISAAARAEIPCVWTGVEKIMAVGDLHGDYDAFTAILIGTGVVDRELHWAAGETHLVQIGDIMDRGPNARAIFDLLRRLEIEAEAAGGRVHVLIGNHEMMNISGISFDYPEYVTAEQFRSFLPEDYIKEKENEALRRRGDGRTEISAEERRALWAEILQNDPEGRRQYLKFFRRQYGQWIADLNTVIKINDTVFVHGGISPAYSLWSLEKINDTVRRELRLVMKNGMFQPQVLYAREGPLWYRDLALQDEALFEDEVDGILANLQARHIVIGHTVLRVPTATAMRRFGGKVWAIDTGISAYYQGPLSALLIEAGCYQVWRVNDE